VQKTGRAVERSLAIFSFSNWLESQQAGPVGLITFRRKQTSDPFPVLWQTNSFVTHTRKRFEPVPGFISGKPEKRPSFGVCDLFA
jgi:hypothetical protein